MYVEFTQTDNICCFIEYNDNIINSFAYFSQVKSVESVEDDITIMTKYEFEKLERKIKEKEQKDENN